MTAELLETLREITPEEQRIIDGKNEIERELYVSSEENTFDAKKLLEKGKLITVRPHTRFVHFPAHTHNYVEVIYMCAGSTRHIVNGNEVLLQQGELLFLNQHAVQEIYPAGKEDIAVNFIILPEFFDDALRMMEAEENMLRRFVIDCLRGNSQSAAYLHFKVADVLPVQNLVENLIWTIRNKQPNKRSINQVTMGLLFLQLVNHIDRVGPDGANTTLTANCRSLRGSCTTIFTGYRAKSSGAPERPTPSLFRRSGSHRRRICSQIRRCP